MKSITQIIALVGLMLSPLASHYVLADATTQLQTLAATGSGPFSASAGEAFWNQSFPNGGEQRSCTTCHGKDPAQSGKHQKTGRSIAPMAVSANPERFTDRTKTEKWFLRNCKWTLGRECTAQEKGDVITWLNQY
ncbi:MAG: DUF1924 domain-containing protein [Thalassolituus sp.]|uniref:DUF1924 domain-containing protein n=1 Tax=Thalassolituus TaxID=187492 RepID=UPI0023F41506|nr:DUF1924 domain-containing protein [Thalassolituus oleivorans]